MLFTISLELFRVLVCYVFQTEGATKQFWTAAVGWGGGWGAIGLNMSTEEVVEQLKCRSIGEQRKVCGRAQESNS